MVQPAGHKSHAVRRNLIVLVLLLAALYVVVPKIHGFGSSAATLRRASAQPTLTALLAVVLAFLFAAFTYYLLALRPLRYGRTLVVQLANLLVNRVVPAGLGGLGLNYEYLRTNKHTAAQAVSVVTLNNLFGFLGNLLLLQSLLAVTTEHSTPKVNISAPSGLVLAIAAALAVLGAIAWHLPPLKRQTRHFLADLGRSLLEYRRRPQRLGLALLSSMALTLGNVLGFYFACHAVGVKVSLLSAGLIQSFGVAVGTAVPTPGGLGGVEASLVAGLVAAGISRSPALAAALLFRLLSYWLPLIIGAVALAITQKRRYVVWKKR